MAKVGLQILPAVRLGALVDLSFLRSHDEEVFVVLVEVEAAAPCQAREVDFLRIIPCVRYELQLHDRLHLQFILAHNPRGNLTI